MPDENKNARMVAFLDQRTCFDGDAEADRR
jgi:hypothetical protein